MAHLVQTVDADGIGGGMIVDVGILALHDWTSVAALHASDDASQSLTILQTTDDEEAGNKVVDDEVADSEVVGVEEVDDEAEQEEGDERTSTALLLDWLDGENDWRVHLHLPIQAEAEAHDVVDVDGEGNT